MQDDYVKSHFSCTAFTEATLLCISEGVGKPLNFPPNWFAQVSNLITSLQLFKMLSLLREILSLIRPVSEILPQPPKSPSVEILGPSSLQVDWLKPSPESPAYDHFIINVTTLKRYIPCTLLLLPKEWNNTSVWRFDPPVDVTLEAPDYAQDLDDHDTIQFVTPKKMQIKVSQSLWRMIPGFDYVSHGDRKLFMIKQRRKDPFLINYLQFAWGKFI